MRRTAAIGLAIATLGFPAPNLAQEMITAADPQAILEIAREFGKATLEEQSTGSPMILGQMHGLRYQVYFLNCDRAEGCEDINFYLGFLNVQPSLERINEWNYTHRFGRAYLDSENDACIEMDLDLVSAVSPEYMRSTFQLWSLVVTEFADFVGHLEGEAESDPS
jgi:hypothetical protein